jgi:ABC-type bacteriocin/lantibiotic exporter with double-glycine peptidase domain
MMGSGAGAIEPLKIIEIPQTVQARFYTCGVAVLQSILYYNGIEYGQDELEPKVGASPMYGTSMEAMRLFLTDRGIGADFRQNMSIFEMKDLIYHDHPVICLVQAWNDDKNHDYTDSWGDGHYIVAIGYDDCRIYFMDPYTIANYTYIRNDDLLKRWHGANKDARYAQAGIIVTNPNPVYKVRDFLPVE